MCTLEKRGNIYILTLTGDDDEHRLNPSLISSIRSSLATIKSQSISSSTALITTAHGKFFSNGLDLNWANQSEPANFLSRLQTMADSLKLLIADLISLPMPTIAAVTGHASAAGFVLAFSHDYVLMRKDKGVLYMSELDIGMTVPEYISTMFREKVGGKFMRDVLLRAVKIRGDEAVRMGIVEKVCDGADEVVEDAVGLGVELSGRGWNGEVYGEMRKSLYPESCRVLGLTTRTVVAPRF